MIKLKTGDYIVMIGVVVITLFVFLLNVQRSYVSKHMEVQVKVGGELIDTFDIGYDMTKVYETHFGINKIVIKDGEVYISDADCPDLICVHSKHVHKNGEGIVCLPNRFSVEIVGHEKGEVDAVSQ